MSHTFRSKKGSTKTDPALAQDGAAAAVDTKKVLHLTVNPTAKQNSKNNKKNGASLTNDCNTKLTQFFQIRRSARKTKKEVEQETLKKYEMAIINMVEDGLEVNYYII